MYRVSVFLLFICCGMGCASLGTRLTHAPLPPGAPEVETVLADLARNDEAVQSFKARGTFTLKTPELETIYLLHQSDISFKRPDYLYVVGRKYAATVLRLTCSGPEFLIELPTERQYYYRAEGEQFAGVSFRISPVDILREAFLPEDWSRLSSRQVRMTAYDAGTQTADLEIYASPRTGTPRRRLTVQGAPWVVLHSQLLDEDGKVVAETAKSEYQVTPEGVRFPARVESAFPHENAFMHFNMRKFDLNAPLDSLNRDIRGRAAALGREGYAEVEPRQSLKQ
jgi:hypothetical protein